jgi:hypothetical protein
MHAPVRGRPPRLYVNNQYRRQSAGAANGDEAGIPLGLGHHRVAMIHLALQNANEAGSANSFPAIVVDVDEIGAQHVEDGLASRDFEGAAVASKADDEAFFRRRRRGRSFIRSYVRHLIRSGGRLMPPNTKLGFKSITA